jgi:hypothetical protein
MASATTVQILVVSEVLLMRRKEFQSWCLEHQSWCLVSGKRILGPRKRASQEGSHVSSHDSMPVHGSPVRVTPQDYANTGVGGRDPPLKAGLDGQGDDSDINDNFDGNGFANYLAPYALAVPFPLLLEPFFKFVWMDY